MFCVIFFLIFFSTTGLESLTQNDLESVFSRNFVIIIHHHYADGIDMQQDVVLQTLKQSMFETFVECRIQSFFLDLSIPLNDFEEEIRSDLSF